MCNWRKWIWPGVLAVFLLTGLAAMLKADLIEQDLADKTLESLKDTHGWAQVTVDGRDVKLSGVAPSEEALGEVISMVEDVPEVRIAASDATIYEPPPIPTISPYEWQATLDGSVVTMNGYVQSEEDRGKIISLVEKHLSNVSITDQTELGKGAPDNFDIAISAALEILSGLKAGKVSFTDKKFSAAGEAGAVGSYEDTISSVSGLPDWLNVESVEIEPATASPYQLSIQKNDASLSIGGHVPSDAVKDSILAAARSAFSDFTIEDQSRIARGAPESVNWLEASKSGIGLLTHLKSGSVAIEDDRFSISGDVESEEIYRRVTDALKMGLDGGIRLAEKDIKLPVAAPYMWLVSKYGSEITLAGHVENDEDNAAVIEMVKRTTGFDAIKNLHGLASGKPEAFDKARQVATELVNTLYNSEAVLADKKLTIKGEADSEATRKKVIEVITTNLPPDYVGEHEIAILNVKPIEPPKLVGKKECQYLLNSSLAKGKINFEVDKAVISQTSTGLLDEIVSSAARCPEARIEIAGHTDSDGDDAYNQKLSEGRAIAVREYLIKKGIAASRLDASGYGESRPLQSNETLEGKARNRRIEFNVIE